MAWPMVFKFGQNMNVDDPRFDPKGQGHRSRSPGSKKLFNASFKGQLDSMSHKKKQVGSHQSRVAPFFI